MRESSQAVQRAPAGIPSLTPLRGIAALLVVAVTAWITFVAGGAARLAAVPATPRLLHLSIPATLTEGLVHSCISPDGGTVAYVGTQPDEPGAAIYALRRRYSASSPEPTA